MPIAPPVSIKVDVAEKDGAYVVRAEIPGVAKDDIQVSIEGNQVTIGAEVKRESEKKDGERVLHSERYYGSAFRSFTLPAELDEAASTAKYENGVLELTLAKKPALAGKQADDPVTPVVAIPERGGGAELPHRLRRRRALSARA